MSNNLYAIIYMVANCFLATSMATIVRLSGSFEPFSLIAGYNVITSFAVLIFLAKSGISIKTQKITLHIVRAFLGTIAYYFYFTAISLTSLPNIFAISYTDPILTCLFAYIILKEKITKSQIIELLAGFICALIIINPASINFDKGGLFILGATIMWALSNITMKILGKTENDFVQIFYASFITMILSFTFAKLKGAEIELSKGYVIAVLALGTLAIFQYFCVFKALTLASAGVTMPFFFTSLVFSSIYAYLIFGEVQKPHELFGTFIIIALNFTQIYIMIKNKKSNN